jgi:probable selenium-dependent hydroxylase accessory protein YqeC
MASDLLDLFQARVGVVCIVGAGGKKTTLYRLATAHPGRVGITSTVLTPPFRKRLGAHVVVADEAKLSAAVASAAQQHDRIAFATPCSKRARLGGVAPWQVIDIHARAGFDVSLVKGDGARLKWMKAPREDEPMIPPADVVIPVLSARAMGAPMSEQTIHRLEEFISVTGARYGEPVTPELVARLLASERGSLKNVGDARVIALINMVDTAEQRAMARDAAEQALALSPKIERVILARMIDDDPIVAVLDGKKAESA